MTLVGRNLRARPERDTEPNDGADAIRAHLCGLPSHARAYVVADDDCAFCIERVEHANEIPDQMEDGVLVDCLRPVALAVAPHVGRHGMEAGFGERREVADARNTSIPESRGRAGRADRFPARRC